MRTAGRDLVTVFTLPFRAQTDPAPKERPPDVEWLNLRVKEEGTNANGSGGRRTRLDFACLPSVPRTAAGAGGVRSRSQTR